MNLLKLQNENKSQKSITRHHLHCNVETIIKFIEKIKSLDSNVDGNSSRTDVEIEWCKLCVTQNSQSFWFR